MFGYLKRSKKVPSLWAAFSSIFWKCKSLFKRFHHSKRGICTRMVLGHFFKGILGCLEVKFFRDFPFVAFSNKLYDVIGFFVFPFYYQPTWWLVDETGEKEIHIDRYKLFNLIIMYRCKQFCTCTAPQSVLCLCTHSTMFLRWAYGWNLGKHNAYWLIIVMHVFYCIFRFRRHK